MAHPRNPGTAEETFAASAGSPGLPGAASFARDAYAPGRWALLRALALEPLRYTDLAKEVELSDGEVTRNLRLLTESGLVRKDLDNRFALSPLGQAALHFGEGLEVLGRHGHILSNLAVDRLPTAQLADLGALAHASVVLD